MNQDFDPRRSNYKSRGEDVRTPNSKLPTYDESLSWDPFIFQFENIASRSGWFDDGVKKGRLLECLRGDALQHNMYVAQEGSYEHVKSKMRQLYQIDMTPTTARINARELKQTEDESEEAFAKRLYKDIRMGYQHMGEVAMNQVAIDVFIQGWMNTSSLERLERIPQNKSQRSIQSSSLWWRRRLRRNTVMTNFQPNKFASRRSPLGSNRLRPESRHNKL